MFQEEFVNDQQARESDPDSGIVELVFVAIPFKHGTDYSHSIVAGGFELMS
jgi:hypothetical protein